MTQALKDLRILITRPAALAASLAQDLKKRGAIPTIFSTIEIHPVRFDAVDLVSESVDKIIFITAAAVHYSVGVHQEMWQRMAAQCEIISMGSGTTAALQQYGIKVDAEPVNEAASETLLALPTLTAVQGKSILIVSGVGGRELLMETLEQRGAHIKKLAVYQRQLPDEPMPQWSKKFDIILSTSGEALANLKQKIVASEQMNLLHTPLLIISKRMLHLARELEFQGPIIMAQGASNAAIIASLIKWKSQ